MGGVGVSRRQGALVVGLLAILGLSALALLASRSEAGPSTASSAPTRTIHFKGEANRDSHIKITLIAVSKQIAPAHRKKPARFKPWYVHKIHFTGLTYKNTVPPLPYGKPGMPLCKPPPGQPIRRYPYTASPSLPLLPPLPNDAFLLDGRRLSFSDDNRSDHDPYELWEIKGHLRWNRVDEIWEATGSFVDAKSEGGLQYGGCSTGLVKWSADNFRIKPVDRNLEAAGLSK